MPEYALNPQNDYLFLSLFPFSVELQNKMHNIQYTESDTDGLREYSRVTKKQSIA